MNDEPVRLRLDPEADPELRASLDAMRDERHDDDARIERLAMRLGPLLGPPGGGGGGGAGPAVKAASAAKAATTWASIAKGVAIAAVIGAAGTLVVVDRRPATTTIPSAPTSAPEPPRSAEEPVSEAQLGSVTGTEPSEDPASAAAGSEPSRAHVGSARPTRREPAVPVELLSAPQVEATTGVVPEVVEPDVPSEAVMLGSAMRGLRSDPAAALAEAERHARHYPSGTMADEREVIAIDALVRLGRRADAEARATRFRDAHPSSPSLRRIERILAN
ncbi:MAG: hypothetical protein J0L92_01710 [Deltaproteobacteria bacterium]|nr:hypothetical protein [Deltaproteobacteria bacterium]